jgi:hypothetical protein
MDGYSYSGYMYMYLYMISYLLRLSEGGSVYIILLTGYRITQVD